MASRTTRSPAAADTSTASIPTVEPQTQAFLDALAAQGSPPLYKRSMSDTLGVLRCAQAGDVATLPADVADRTIPGGPDGQVSIRVVRPTGSTGTPPAGMYSHGGRWILVTRTRNELTMCLPTSDPATTDTIVPIHGLWLTGLSWEHWVERDSVRGFLVVARNWPGMEGDSEALRRDPSAIAGLDVSKIVDHHHALVHATIGGCVTVRFALNGPFRSDGLHETVRVKTVRK